MCLLQESLSLLSTGTGVFGSQAASVHPSVSNSGIACSLGSVVPFDWGRGSSIQGFIILDFDLWAASCCQSRLNGWMDGLVGYPSESWAVRNGQVWNGVGSHVCIGYPSEATAGRGRADGADGDLGASWSWLDLERGLEA